MKTWEQWPYWLRGAVVAVAICLFFILFQTVIVPKFFYGVCGDSYCISGFALGVQAIFHFITIPLLYSIAGEAFLENPALFFFVSLVYCFFIGAFIGLMYGKIRHGKDTIHPPKME